MLLFSATVRFRIRTAAFERDEGEYAYAGQLILQGIPPYQLAYNMKFPGTYLAYAAIMGVFGQTRAGVHTGFIFVNAAGILFVYLLTARLGGRAAGLAAAAIYTYGSLSGQFLGTSAHATHFVVAAALGGLVLLLRSLERQSLPGLFGSGVLLGTGVLMKQHGAFFVMFAAAYLVYHQMKAGNRASTVKRFAVFAFGVTLPLALTGLWLWRAGVFPKFWFWTISYAREYASEYQGLAETWVRLKLATPELICISLCAAVPGLIVLWRRPDRAAAVFATGLLVFSALAVFPGFNFWLHYFILPLPATAMLSGIAVAALAASFAKHGSAHGQAATFGLLAVALLGSAVRERELFFTCAPEDIARLVYGPIHPFPESVKVADYLREHTPPDARIAVLGSEPQIYFYSRRHSATGYIYTYGMMEPQPFALQMQHEMIQEIEAARPEYLVLLRMPASWLAHTNSDPTIFKWAQHYIDTNCTVVGAVDITRAGANYYWDAEAPDHTDNAQILVLKCGSK